MDTHHDTKMLEAIICALLGRSSGKVTLTVKEIAEADAAHRIHLETDWMGERVVLSLETAPDQTPPQAPQQGRRMRRARVRQI